MKNLTLNRAQVEKLTEIVNRFPEVKKFTVAVDHSSGIGQGIVVQLSLWDTNDTQIDITDLGAW